jgi:glycerol uptake facilitator-like aquaporin
MRELPGAEKAEREGKNAKYQWALVISEIVGAIVLCVAIWFYYQH